MTETLKNAVVSALYDTFGDDVAIYTETVRQGLKRPCFFVEISKFSERHLVLNRYIRTYPVKITYFPSPEDIPTRRNYEMDKVLEKLFFKMGHITDFNGSGMEAQNTGDSLQFSVQYKSVINKAPETEADMMECVKHIISKGSE